MDHALKFFPADEEVVHACDKARVVGQLAVNREDACEATNKVNIAHKTRCWLLVPCTSPGLGGLDVAVVTK